MTIATITKEIRYSRLTKDYDMLLDGEYVGSEASYHAAEVELDRLAYEQLNRAGVEPELLQSATALDGGSDADEIAAAYAEALPTCAACHTNEHAASALQPAFCTECVYAMLQGRKSRLDMPVSTETDDSLTTAIHLNGETSTRQHASLDKRDEYLRYNPSAWIVAEHAVPVCPKCQRPIGQRVYDPHTGMCMDCYSTNEPSHNLVTPDPAERPDISAPQPVEGLTTCERYSTPPVLSDTPRDAWGEPVPEWLLESLAPSRCTNCDGPHHIQRCGEVWRALMG